MYALVTAIYLGIIYLKKKIRCEFENLRYHKKKLLHANKRVGIGKRI